MMDAGGNSNAMILQILKGLLEAQDKKSLASYFKKPEADASMTGDAEMPELSPEELAALESDDDEMMEA